MTLRLGLLLALLGSWCGTKVGPRESRPGWAKLTTVCAVPDEGKVALIAVGSADKPDPAKKADAGSAPPVAAAETSTTGTGAAAVTPEEKAMNRTVEDRARDNLRELLESLSEHADAAGAARRKQACEGKGPEVETCPPFRELAARATIVEQGHDEGGGWAIARLNALLLPGELARVAAPGGKVAPKGAPSPAVPPCDPWR